ncbi:MAG: formamidopyrimidine-DNA glycosylase [Deltaproteobacteria bacterium]|nr:formamidopyrimidine-DNA glycosylase [Deltaproteobacteria bacterium]
MPELPDITLYVEHLHRRTAGTTLLSLRLRSPFLLRTVDPPLSSAAPRRVLDVTRLGKRVVFALDGDLFLSLHLMIAGRLHWKKPGAKPPGKFGLAAFDFDQGTLLLTEASAKKRAALHLVRGAPALATLDRGGLEPLDADLPAFREALLRESHTLKRALTDPRLFSGIGNAYSDEILHRARLSPLRLSSALSPDELSRLHSSTQSTLREWTDRLRTEAGDVFPEKVTAFREGMAVHGRYGKPCPVCGTAVQRIRYAENEANYCPRCQIGGRLLADRSLSRLLHHDWPKTIDELEERRRRTRPERS